MRLVMFTPIVSRSAIGRVARLVTRELLSAGHEVLIVRTEAAVAVAGEIHEFGVPLLSWNDQDSVIDAVLSADIAVYQVGDNYQFHAGCAEWMPRLPGIVCLHDFFVGHYFLGWCHEHGHQPGAVIRAWYGEDVAASYQIARHSPDFIESTARTAPLTEWVCSQAIGVLTHSKWGIDRVVRSCPGPIRVAPLPYEALSVDLAVAGVPDSGCFRVLTVGHVNANKRAATVICAIASSPSLRERSVYNLVGSIEPRMVHELAALARSLDVRLVIGGAVGDQALSNAFAEADVVVALRWPCLEAASASAIESMLVGKPTIVVRAGSYDEIPDDCVIKVDVNSEVRETREALEFLMGHPSERAAMAARGKERAQRLHRPDQYAAELVDLAREALRANPPLDAVSHAVGSLRQWGANSDVGHEYIFPPIFDLLGDNVREDRLQID
jgi:glycosyltransferase involved in cell wall biosynthesis